MYYLEANITSFVLPSDDWHEGCESLIGYQNIVSKYLELVLVVNVILHP